MYSRVCTGALFVLLLAIGVLPAARAQQPASAGQAAPPGSWIFEVAPYLWFPTVNLSLNYNLPPALGGRLPTDCLSGPVISMATLITGPCFRQTSATAHSHC